MMSENAANRDQLTQMAFLALVELALNEALKRDATALELIAKHQGKTVRIRTVSPEWSVYLSLSGEGVHLFSDHEGPISARVKAPASLYARYLLGTRDVEVQDGEFTLSGDLSLLQELADIAGRYNIWSISQAFFADWLPEHSGLNDFLRILKSYDPAWIDRLQHMPQMTQDIVTELQRQGQRQERQLMELSDIRQRMEYVRYKDMATALLGLLLVGYGMLSAVPEHWGLPGLLLSLQSSQGLFFVAVGSLLLVPQLVAYFKVRS